MKNNSQRAIALSLTGDLTKPDKYEIYKNGKGELFIVESKDIDKKMKSSNPIDIYENILLDVMAIGQSLPFIPYEEWSEKEKETGANYALYFCNKYGLLGMEKYFLEGNGYRTYHLHKKIGEEIWCPIDGELKRVKKESKNYIEEYDNWGSLVFDFLSMMAPDADKIKRLYKVFGEKYLPKDFSLEDLEDIEWLFRFSKMFSTIKPPVFSKNEITKGEPVEMIVDIIWYLYRYARIWDYFRNNEIDIKDTYTPVKCDNSERLWKKFYYPFKSRYVDDEVLWPTWKEVLTHLDTDSFHGTQIKYGMRKNSNNEWQYNIEFPTLYETLCHFLLIEIDSQNRTVRFCKNCGGLLLDDNRHVQYCSVQCRNQYNVRMHRQRKAKESANENKE